MGNKRSSNLVWLQLLTVLSGVLLGGALVKAAETSGADAKASLFLDWLHEGGADISGVALSDFIDGRPVSSLGACSQDGISCYRGVVATQDISAGATVVSIPLNLGVYDFDGAAGLPEPYAESIPETRLAAWLCRQRSLGSTSRFAPYLDMLPKAIPMPLFYQNKEAEAAALLPCHAGMQELLNWTRDEFDKSNPDALGGASFVTFKWAFAIVLSRTFETRVLLGGSEDGALSAMIMMLPFADMINHSPHNQLVWQLDDGGQRFEMTATRDIAKGEEVFTTYGSKTNEQWLLYYGYVPEDNPADRMPLFDTYEDAAAWYIQSRPPPHTAPSAKKVTAAIAAAVKAAQETLSDETDEGLALSEKEADKRLWAIFATLWVHLDSKNELGYACSQSVSLWSFRRRSECEVIAGLAAQRALIRLYKSTLERFDESVVKLRRQIKRFGRGKGAVYTNLQVLERYALQRKELVERALAIVQQGVADEELKRKTSKEL
ncbi:hypothetical protein KFL_003160040 [Klebsormidium nitens]|uniref:SET domain-containing protein n=1 Tax=Klebsormidium nitens TaxID=105231 RepID=A0A1Y1ICM8_KLENI|nr:hypothetical protein KFL_003160040 [Klebsormidium nitens]|eukprot:GAQ86851.1 hypothetical protein KFL_003160040 [Klebsormidium nitens]